MRKWHPNPVLPTPGTTLAVHDIAEATMLVNPKPTHNYEKKTQGKRTLPKLEVAHPHTCLAVGKSIQGDCCSMLVAVYNQLFPFISW